MGKSRASEIGRLMAEIRMKRTTPEQRRAIATHASKAAAEARTRRALERRAAAEAAEAEAVSA